MSILSKLGRFLSDVTSGPEDEVNELSLAVVAACKRDVPDEQRLQMLKTVAEKHRTVQARFDHFSALRGGSKASTLDVVCTYIVAIGDKILALLGEDFGPSVYSSEEENIRIHQSCELQRARINLANVNREDLRDALWQAFGVKVNWKVTGDPRWKLCRITDLELWARDEWNRTHPMPKDQNVISDE